MNARSTVSGTISELMEPCRKKFKSSRDQVGTWAIWVAADFTTGCVGCSSDEVVHEVKVASAETRRRRQMRSGFMRAEFSAERFVVKQRPQRRAAPIHGERS